MPIYEYRCQSCRKRTSVFVRSVSSNVTAVCQHCGSSKISRMMSRVAVLRSDGDSPAGFDESSLGDLDENDPRSMAKWIRKMSNDMGEPLDAEMENDLDRMEAGEVPDDGVDDGDSFEDEFASVD
jgi:putative FmdB family regulatory protein